MQRNTIMTDNIYTQISNRRKQEQLDGLMPMWYSTAGAQMFYDKYEYETNGRSVRGQFERIAKTAAKHLKGTTLEKDAETAFFDLLWKGWLSPSTPVLANMGTNRGMPVSCSGSVVGDSIDGFYTAYRETALLTKYGFGTSGYLGDIRPRGSAISVGGKASGVVPVFKRFVQDMRDVAQGTARRGAWAGYLPIDHGDFDELVEHVMADPDDANVGWVATDKFIALMNLGDKEAIRRYQKAMKAKMVLGKGYWSFIDKVNNKRPEWYKALGLEVKASNLCLRGDTLIDVEDSGRHETLTISDFVEKFELGYYADPKVKTIKDGKTIYSSVTAAAKTGTATELIRIETESGKIIECTANHLIFTKNRGWVEAGNLVETDELLEL